ncbi:hypothetical protein Tco_0989119 [Tanacetum coccineum]|uniref:Uncharacterized protein n=1 Tax=Tanacetum coccineum TaxID=301880 RepID=A0ABQ5ET35_9ASTR
MSSSSTVTYTSVYTNSEPGRVFWGVDEELPEHPPSPNYVPDPEHLPSPVEIPYVPEPEYPEYLTPIRTRIRRRTNPEEDHADYPANGGDGDDEPSDDDDDDDDTNEEDEEPFEDEDDDEEEEHLAPADSSAIPVVDPIPSAGDTEAFETDKAEVERLFALPILPTSPLSPWSSLLPQIPSPPLPPPPSSLHLPPPVPTSLPLPSSPLPPLPASLSIPPPVNRREDTPEAELPPRKRLCLTTPTLRNEVGESSTVAPRPTGGHRVDYGFIGTVNAEIGHQRAEEVGYGIRDVWVDVAEAVEEVAPMM